MWFNLLKAELASQSGYAQLDFDNILEEEEADCKKRYMEMAKRLEKMAEEVERTLPEEIDKITGDVGAKFIRFDKHKVYDGIDMSIIEIFYDTDDIPKMPEEVVCKALEFLDSNDRNNRITIGNYRIVQWTYSPIKKYFGFRTSKRVHIYNVLDDHNAILGFIANIKRKKEKYSQDLYDKLAGVMK